MKQFKYDLFCCIMEQLLLFVIYSNYLEKKLSHRHRYSEQYIEQYMFALHEWTDTYIT